MAEIEIGVLSRQALSGYVATKEEMMERVAAWQADRNAERSTVKGNLRHKTLGSSSKDYTL